MSFWTTTRTADGSPTLVRQADGTAMHSLDGAWTQACLRYAAAVLIPGALTPGQPFRLLDVGTGSGLNLAAALARTQPLGVPLEVLALERDPRGLREALAWGELAPSSPASALGPQLPPWEAWHGPVRAALAAALAQGSGVPVPLAGTGRLRLVLGDARDSLPPWGREAPFDGVFLDPFAPAQEPELWAPQWVAEVARRMAPGARLATYSSSLGVRVALAAAGLEVGRGARVGGKAQGTLACRGTGAQPWAPLEPRVAAKLARRLARKNAPHPRGG